MSGQPVGILLAAGSSQRFGDNKLLYPVIEDMPMLLVSAQKMASVLPNSIVVINEPLKKYQDQLEQLDLLVVINKDADRGMASSIVCGISHSADASGWLISLADMPYIKQQTLSLLADKLKAGASIIAPEFNKQRGHPVGFNKKRIPFIAKGFCLPDEPAV